MLSLYLSIGRFLVVGLGTMEFHESGSDDFVAMSIGLVGPAFDCIFAGHTGLDDVFILCGEQFVDWKHFWSFLGGVL